MAKSSNASSSYFGVDFQRNAAIVLLLKNIEKVSKIKVEGQKEDIEITLNNEKIIYSQVKSVEKQEDTSHVIQKLEDALKTLNEASKEPNVDSLIYVTNSPNPFNSIKTMYNFSGSYTLLKYNNLNSICREKIDNICKKNDYFLDKNQLSVCVIQFPYELDNRYKVVKDVINEFLYKLDISDKGYGNILLEIWQNDFFKNITIKRICITKKQVIWPIIVLLCKINRNDAKLINLDDGEFSEIKKNYESVIYNNSERFTFITKVVSLYQNYKDTKKSEDIDNNVFIESHWQHFKEEIDLKLATPDIIKKVLCLTLSNVINNRYDINRIKKAVNL